MGFAGKRGYRGFEGNAIRKEFHIIVGQYKLKPIFNQTTSKS